MAEREIISERRFVMAHEATAGRTFFSLLFVLWGFGYGAFVLVTVASAEGQSSLGVGTSAAVVMRICFWMGGMILFGILALLSPTRSTMRIHDPMPPAGG